MIKPGIALTLVISLGLFTAFASACPWDGYYGGGPAPSGDYQTFLDETVNLRKELAGNRAEYEALMARPDPDPTRASKLSQEIFDLQNQLQEKSQKYGVSRMGHRGGNYHRGPYRSGGWNCGAYCW